MVTSTLGKLFVTLEASVIFWVASTLKRSSAGVVVVRWVAAVVPSDVATDGTGTDQESE